MMQNLKQKKTTRRLKWVSALEQDSSKLLAGLQKQLALYYQRAQYYEDIVPGTQLWKQLDQEPIHRDIIDRIRNLKALEIGCGKSEILTTGEINAASYSGTDFSEDLMAGNREKYPGATFCALGDGGTLPFPDESFEAVFSIFVIEHAVYPQFFLDEAVRVLRPGGTFLLLCPDFLGKDRMTSQRVGFSLGSGRQKIKRGKILDALVTSYDQRVRIPRYARQCKGMADESPKFFINVNPVCFEEQEFRPDVDAVYLTYKPEMINYLKDRVSIEENSGKIRETEDLRRLIYMVGRKLS